jgi:hypothetical protein
MAALGLYEIITASPGKNEEKGEHGISASM